jgi:hypothetical protein
VATEHLPSGRALLLQRGRLRREPQQRAKVLNQHHIHHSAEAREMVADLQGRGAHRGEQGGQMDEGDT